MKSAVYSIPGKFKIIIAADPKIQNPTDVLLRVHSVGVCGSDLHYFRVNRIGEQVIDGPFIMGHECTAVVEAVGADVKRVKPGDHVAVEPAISCGSCEQCLDRRPHTCLHLTFLGAPGQLDGALKEFIIMPEENCYLIPENLNLSTAIWVEPLSIGLYASRMVRSLYPLDTGVLGAGPIGLSVLHAIQISGWEPVLVTDKLHYRLEIAKLFYAQNTCSPNIESDLEPFSHSLDIVFECCGQQDAFDQAVRLLKPGGHLVVVGIPEVEAWTIDPHQLRRKEITIHNVRRQNGCIKPAIDMLVASVEKFKPLITHVFPLEEIEKAFELTESYQDGVMKTIIKL